jgi:hypothetical protein
VTDSLRTKIVAALDDCRTLTPDAQADAIMPIVEVEIARVRQHALAFTERGTCRSCFGTDDTWTGSAKRPHKMWCRNYVGPLAHRRDRLHDDVYHVMDKCTCGRSYRAEDGPCPDAGITWREREPVTVDPWYWAPICLAVLGVGRWLFVAFDYE